MPVKKFRPPFVLLVISIGIVILGILYRNFILINIPEQDQIDNVILIAIPFIFYFVAILLVYIFLINISGQLLSGRVPEKLYKIINYVIIAGIILGIIMMLQPFTIVLYKISFMVVFISLLLFMIWSHINPAFSPLEDEE
jgi:hypothetical protein